MEKEKRLPHYILDENRKPVVVYDVLEWAKQFESMDRKVAREMVGDRIVSTVFLGLDMSWGGNPPLLFETMVFKPATQEDVDCFNKPPFPLKIKVGDPKEDSRFDMVRYATWDEAVEGHNKKVEEVRQALKNDQLSTGK